jgi:hypothetical protein
MDSAYWRKELIDLNLFYSDVFKKKEAFTPSQ